MKSIANSIEHGANIDDQDYLSGNVPLHFAVSFAQTARSYGKLVPLHIAIMARSVEIVKLLLDNYSDVGLRCDEGFNALEYAMNIKDATPKPCRNDGRPASTRFERP